MEGVEQLADTELLALLLGTGDRGRSALELAATLLAQSGGAHRLAAESACSLASRRGVGPAKATRILAGLQLGRRALLSELAEQRPLCADFAAVVAWARPRLAGLGHEEVWALALDGRHGIKSQRRVATGGVHGAALTAADILRPALLDAATALIVVHNHPSGDPNPSEDDVQMTRALAAACRAVAIPLLDHVIVAREGACSLSQLGALSYCA